MNKDLEECLQLLIKIGEKIRAKIVIEIVNQSIEKKASIHKIGHDDIIYQIDKDVEDLILEEIDRYADTLGGVVLIAEGLGEEGQPLILPASKTTTTARWRVIIDPIDGTRGIMYDKRSAFYLAAVAENKGDITSLNDIQAAVMMELPTSKSSISDSFTAMKGKGVIGQRTNLVTNKSSEIFVTPSKSGSIYGGFAQFSRFFSPGKDVIAALEEELIHKLFPNAPDGQAFVFEDQYISTGGQFYELLMGHDRFTADIRAALYLKFQSEGKKTGLACHPYDICVKIILEESGILITDLYGDSLNCKLDTTSNVSFLAFANPLIRSEVWPHLKVLLSKYDLI